MMPADSRLMALVDEIDSACGTLTRLGYGLTAKRLRAAKEAAIAAWNTRAAEPGLERERVARALYRVETGISAHYYTPPDESEYWLNRADHFIDAYKAAPARGGER